MVPGTPSIVEYSINHHRFSSVFCAAQYSVLVGYCVKMGDSRLETHVSTVVYSEYEKERYKYARRSVRPPRLGLHNSQACRKLEVMPVGRMSYCGLRHTTVRSTRVPGTVKVSYILGSVEQKRSGPWKSNVKTRENLRLEKGSLT